MCSDARCRLTTQAQRPGPRDATIATVARWPGSLQRMVRPTLSVSDNLKHVVPPLLKSHYASVAKFLKLRASLLNAAPYHGRVYSLAKSQELALSFCKKLLPFLW